MSLYHPVGRGRGGAQWAKWGPVFHIMHMGNLFVWHAQNSVHVALTVPIRQRLREMGAAGVKLYGGDVRVGRMWTGKIFI